MLFAKQLPYPTEEEWTRKNDAVVDRFGALAGILSCSHRTARSSSVGREAEAIDLQSLGAVLGQSSYRKEHL